MREAKIASHRVEETVARGGRSSGRREGNLERILRRPEIDAFAEGLRSPNLQVYLERILRKPEIDAFAEELRPHRVRCEVPKQEHQLFLGRSKEQDLFNKLYSD